MSHFFYIWNKNVIKSCIFFTKLFVQSKEKLYFCKRNEKKTYMTNLNAYYYFYFYFANTL